MSYKDPLKPTMSALKGIDKKIEDIKDQMSFSWLTEAFGLADRVIVDEAIVPACFEGNRVDPISMMPSDLYKAFCFWVKNPEVTEVQSEYPNRFPIHTYAVGCIFYMDIRRIDNTLTYKETKSKIREDIYDFFNNVHFAGKLTYVGAVEDDLSLIYDGFSEIDGRWKQYPKWAIRINFLLSFRDECYSTNTYTTT